MTPELLECGASEAPHRFGFLTTCACGTIQSGSLAAALKTPKKSPADGFVVNRLEGSYWSRIKLTAITAMPPIMP